MSESHYLLHFDAPNPNPKVNLNRKRQHGSNGRVKQRLLSIMTTLPNWRRGRPRHLILNVETTSQPEERSDIALYPSKDGKRVLREAPSPPKKRQRRVEPSQLNDSYALWMPGIVEEVLGEYEDSGSSAAATVVVNVDADRQRYISSVSFILSLLIFLTNWARARIIP